jgi:hypothetical protein
MLIMLARLAFLLTIGFIGGVLLGLISLKSETSRLAEAALSLHQTQDAQGDSAVGMGSASRRATKLVAAKRGASREASKRAAKLSSSPQASRLAGNFH